MSTYAKIVKFFSLNGKELFKFLSFAGSGAAFIGIVFVFKQTDHALGEIKFWPSGFEFTWLLSLALLSLLSHSEAWLWLLRHHSVHVRRTKNLQIISRFHILKYLPGSFWQYLVRHIQLSVEKVKHGTLVKIALYEILILCVASLSIAIVLLFFIVGWGIFITIGAFLASGMLIYFYRKTKGPLLTSITLYIVYTLIHCSGFAIALAIATEGKVAFDASLIAIFIYLISWVVGMLVPGAPGGIGVREATALMLMQQSPISIIEFSAAMIIVRISYVFAEVLYFGLNNIISRNFKS